MKKGNTQLDSPQIYCIGSCRTCSCFQNASSPTDYTHTTKEILQLLKKDFRMYTDEFILVNRHLKNKKRCSNQIETIRKMLTTADVIVLEISSVKIVFNKEKDLYFNIDLYNHILNKTNYNLLKNNQKALFKLYDRSDTIIKNTTIIKQTRQDIYSDLEEIYKLLNNNKKKLILVPHINAKLINNDDNSLFNIPERVLLCDTLKQFSDDKDNMYFFDPMHYLKDDYNTIFEKDSVGHYSEFAKNIIKENINNYIQNI